MEGFARFMLQKTQLKLKPEYKKFLLSDPLDPALLLNALNKIVYSTFQRKLVMSAFVTTMDFESKRVVYANAGHEMPIIIRSVEKEGRTAYDVLKATGPRLGEQVASEYKSWETKFEKEDTLFWSTDGIIERANSRNREYGDRRLLNVLAKNPASSANEIRDRLLADFHSYCRDQPPVHDFTFIVGKVKKRQGRNAG
jgi:sigma-B regulation protein RsbU (phosphoserine phosphatase)